MYRMSLLLALVVLSIPVRSARTAEASAADEEMQKLGGKCIGTGFRASFSHDGKKIVYSKADATSGAGDTLGIAVYDIVSGETTDLIKPGKDPAWQPHEGKYVAYVVNNADAEEIWLCDTHGKNARKIADGGMPTWSKRGKAIFFHSRKRGAQMVVTLADGRPRETSTLLPLASSWYPAVNLQGTHVTWFEGTTLKVVDLATKEEKKFVVSAATDGGLPNWSSDGRLIGFGGYGTVEDLGFWMFDPRSGKAAQVCKGHYTMPSWSPDGKSIVCDRRDGSGPFTVWAFDATKLSDLSWQENRFTAEAPQPSEPLVPDPASPPVPIDVIE